MPEVTEKKIMTVWPGIGSMALGRWVGRMAGNRFGYGFFTLGKLLALATIPISLGTYLWRLMPGVCRRYTLTSRRLIIQHGLTAKDGLSIGLDEFDSVKVALLPGQEWLHAGELILQFDGKEVFRLSGVSRPEGFRQVCLKARSALIHGRQVCQQQAAVAAPPA
jgi:hypothetical protein